MAVLPPLLVFGAWFVAHADVLVWLASQYGRGDRRVEAVLLAGVVALAWRRFGSPSLVCAPRMHPAPAPLVLLAVCLAGEVLAGPLDVHFFDAALFAAGTWALVGLWAPPPAWRAALPWAGLVAATLPFGPMADVYLGFPARVLTAEVVRTLLDAAGIATLSRETVLLLDRTGGTATIDVAVPCAGVRSLWAAGVFLLGAAAVEGRPLDRRFVVGAVVTGAGVILANVVRVTTLVLVGGVAGASELADALHVPLGLVGFAIAAGTGWLVLGPAETPDMPRVEAPRPAPRLLPFVVTVSVLIVSALRPGPSPSPSELPLAYAPEGIGAAPIVPVEAERRWFAEIGVSVPRKWRFDDGDLSGTLLVSPARAWRAHHPPEACLAAQGLTVEGPWSAALAPDLHVRMARVRGSGAATALWWFQSPGGTTDDHTARTWSAVLGRETRWVLVSALLDGERSPAEVAAFAAARRAELAAALSSLPPEGS